MSPLFSAGQSNTSATKAALTATSCVHHWICESPGLGHEVPARCKLCGLERTFYPERGLDMFKEQRSSQAKMANRKGQPKRHPKKVVAA